MRSAYSLISCDTNLKIEGKAKKEPIQGPLPPPYKNATIITDAKEVFSLFNTDLGSENL